MYRSYLRFFDDGLVMNAETAHDEPVEGSRVRWLAQTATGEQVELAGTWSDSELVLDERHLGPDAVIERETAVRYVYRAVAELAMSPQKTVNVTRKPDKAKARKKARR
jgi:hypothetical protein